MYFRQCGAGYASPAHSMNPEAITITSELISGHKRRACRETLLLRPLPESSSIDTNCQPMGTPLLSKETMATERIHTSSTHILTIHLKQSPINRTQVSQNCYPSLEIK